MLISRPFWLLFGALPLYTSPSRFFHIPSELSSEPSHCIHLLLAPFTSLQNCLPSASTVYISFLLLSRPFRLVFRALPLYTCPSCFFLIPSKLCSELSHCIPLLPASFTSLQNWLPSSPIVHLSFLLLSRPFRIVFRALLLLAPFTSILYCVPSSSTVYLSFLLLSRPFRLVFRALPLFTSPSCSFHVPSELYSELFYWIHLLLASFTSLQTCVSSSPIVYLSFLLLSHPFWIVFRALPLYTSPSCSFRVPSGFVFRSLPLYTSPSCSFHVPSDLCSDLSHCIPLLLASFSSLRNCIPSSPTVYLSFLLLLRPFRNVFRVLLLYTSPSCSFHVPSDLCSELSHCIPLLLASFTSLQNCLPSCPTVYLSFLLLSRPFRIVFRVLLRYTSSSPFTSLQTCVPSSHTVYLSFLLLSRPFGIVFWALLLYTSLSCSFHVPSELCSELSHCIPLLLASFKSLQNCVHRASTVYITLFSFHIPSDLCSELSHCIPLLLDPFTSLQNCVPSASTVYISFLLLSRPFRLVFRAFPLYTSPSCSFHVPSELCSERFYCTHLLLAPFTSLQNCVLSSPTVQLSFLLLSRPFRIVFRALLLYTSPSCFFQVPSDLCSDLSHYIPLLLAPFTSLQTCVPSSPTVYLSFAPFMSLQNCVPSSSTVYISFLLLSRPFRLVFRALPLYTCPSCSFHIPFELCYELSHWIPLLLAPFISLQDLCSNLSHYIPLLLAPFTSLQTCFPTSPTVHLSFLLLSRSFRIVFRAHLLYTSRSCSSHVPLDLFSKLSHCIPLLLASFTSLQNCIPRSYTVYLSFLLLSRPFRIVFRALLLYTSPSCFFHVPSDLCFEIFHCLPLFLASFTFLQNCVPRSSTVYLSFLLLSRPFWIVFRALLLYTSPSCSFHVPSVLCFRALLLYNSPSCSFLVPSTFVLRALLLYTSPFCYFHVPSKLRSEIFCSIPLLLARFMSLKNCAQSSSTVYLSFLLLSRPLKLYSELFCCITLLLASFMSLKNCAPSSSTVYLSFLRFHVPSELCSELFYCIPLLLALFTSLQNCVPSSSTVFLSFLLLSRSFIIVFGALLLYTSHSCSFHVPSDCVPSSSTVFLSHSCSFHVPSDLCSELFHCISLLVAPLTSPQSCVPSFSAVYLSFLLLSRPFRIVFRAVPGDLEIWPYHQSCQFFSIFAFRETSPCKMTSSFLNLYSLKAGMLRYTSKRNYERNNIFQKVPLLISTRNCSI